jgi:hypothetical protein
VGGEKGVPVVLAVARAARTRRWVTATLTPEFGVCELAPEDLLDPAPWIDAAAALVALDQDDDHSILAALDGLSSIPARGALVLLLDGAPEDLVEAALDRLAPTQVLGPRVAPSVLRYALRRALPSEAPGEGARSHHRPTPALLGVSSAIREVIEHIRQIAPTQIPALILGETGTGKELVARAIHEQSTRCGRPFVAVNCGALPDSLLESELFGHCRGAFTGADRHKRGLFEYADGGTIFLDEIGDTSQALRRSVSTCASCRLPTAISRTPSRRDASARISTTASTRSRSSCHPCDAAAWTSPSWPSTSPRSSARRTRVASHSAKTSFSRSPSANSPATCASCATPWNAPSRWQRRGSP